MAQKILKIGSSSGVILPKKSLDKLGLKEGDQVEVKTDPETKSFVINAVADTTVDKELIDWSDDFINTYREALEALSDK